MNKRKFKASIKRDIEIVLDMDKYTEESIEQYENYWEHEFDSNEDTIQEIIKHIAYNYQRDGYFDKDAEGLVLESFEGVDIGTNIEVSEIL